MKADSNHRPILLLLTAARRLAGHKSLGSVLSLNISKVGYTVQQGMQFFNLICDFE